jgi:hypothetical protein
VLGRRLQASGVLLQPVAMAPGLTAFSQIPSRDQRRVASAESITAAVFDSVE